MPSKGGAALVAVCVAVGFLLRLRGIDQSLWADEFLTRDHLDGSLGHVIDRLVNDRAEGSENNPPLYFLLAWVSTKLGHPGATMRLPSVLLGTATIPLAYALGVRTVGRTAAAVAAVGLTFSPFAIYYANDARPYATLMFLAALSTLALVRAVEERRPAWWAVYAVSVCAVLYTHNTGVFVLGAQGAWALWAHRDQWRWVVGANLAAAIGYLPWLPNLQGRNLWIFDLLAESLHLGTAETVVVWLLGVPFVPVSVVPGLVPLALLALGLGVGALALAGGPRPSDRVALIALLAVATPLGLLAYWLLTDHNLFALARNQSASLVPALLLAGWLLTRPRDTVQRAVALGLAGLALALVAVETLDDRFARPPFEDAANFVEAEAQPKDGLLYGGTPLGQQVLRAYLGAYLEAAHPVYAADDAGFEQALQTAGPGGTLFVVRLQSSRAPDLSPQLARELRLVEEHEFPPGKPWVGNPGLVVSVFSARS